MKKLRRFIIFLSVVVLVFPLYAQAQRETPPLKIAKITESLYEATGGSGANTGFFIGENQVVVIDAKMSKESAVQMIEEIKKLTPNPVKCVILTHSDGDHVNGLSGFPKGIEIISHRNSYQHMDKAFEDLELREHLPNITFSQEMNLYTEGEKIRLIHFYPAHTDGDIVVFFPEQKVAYIGDLIFLDRDPLIHKHKNGNSFGLVKTLKGILGLEADIFIHGHGERAQKKDIQEFVDSLEKKQERIKNLINQGKSLEEVKKEFGIEESESRRPSIVEIIYQEIKNL